MKKDNSPSFSLSVLAILNAPIEHDKGERILSLFSWELEHIRKHENYSKDVDGTERLCGHRIVKELK